MWIYRPWLLLQGYVTESDLCHVIVVYCFTFQQVSIPANDGYIIIAHYVDPTFMSCPGLMQNNVSILPHRQIIPETFQWPSRLTIRVPANTYLRLISFKTYPYTVKTSTGFLYRVLKWWKDYDHNFARMWWLSEQKTITNLKTCLSFIPKTTILKWPCGSDTSGMLGFNHTHNTKTCSCMKYGFLFQQLTSSH